LISRGCLRRPFVKIEGRAVSLPVLAGQAVDVGGVTDPKALTAVAVRESLSNRKKSIPFGRNLHKASSRKVSLKLFSNTAKSYPAPFAMAYQR
jgi:hypothetical protein